VCSEGACSVVREGTIVLFSWSKGHVAGRESVWRCVVCEKSMVPVRGLAAR
jgi:hypothetical protein